MELGRIVGQVVSTVRCPGMPHNSLLWVDLLDAKGEPTGRREVAVDPIGAGDGEWVIVSRGSSARFAIGQEPPIDLAIVHCGSRQRRRYRGVSQEQRMRFCLARRGAVCCYKNGCIVSQPPF